MGGRGAHYIVNLSEIAAAGSAMGCNTCAISRRFDTLH
jgi:hypothetical protein